MKSFPAHSQYIDKKNEGRKRKGCRFLTVHLWNERGSATIEFITLSIPLLIPFALYLTVVNGNAQISYEAHTLARQLARVFVTSPSEQLTPARLETVMNSHIFPKDIKAEYQIECSLQPCLTSGSSVRITVTMTRGSDRVIARDTQVVDKWRNS